MFHILRVSQAQCPGASSTWKDWYDRTVQKDKRNKEKPERSRNMWVRILFFQNFFLYSLSFSYRKGRTERRAYRDPKQALMSPGKTRRKKKSAENRSQTREKLDRGDIKYHPPYLLQKQREDAKIHKFYPQVGLQLWQCFKCCLFVVQIVCFIADNYKS